MTMRLLDDMVRDQDPLTLSQRTSVREACRRMRARNVGAVLVTGDDGRLVGIFTGRDAVCRVLAEGKDPATTHLSGVMSGDPCTIPPRRPAIEALRLMQDGGFRHVPIVEDGKIVGVVSRGDFRG
ncbi:MAG: CBS domain-containing protein, partial [Alphaproteobacteria bacterium]|nr:CBS domain-containing protein [Alphaproteobacteria bacterium]